MLTELEVSSLVCKYVFYRPEHNAKGYSIPRDRARRVGEKNVVFCLVIMFTPRVVVIKM